MAPQCSTIRLKPLASVEDGFGTTGVQIDTPVKSRSSVYSSGSGSLLPAVYASPSRTMTCLSVLAIGLVAFVCAHTISCQWLNGWCLTKCGGSHAAALAAIGENTSESLQWLRGGAAAASPPDLPSDFDWRAYLKWNPELELQGIHTKQAAEHHYVREGHLKSLVYVDYELTIRYTACGGLMNQHYCHMATIALASMAKADKIIWPPMQERKSFHIRYHPDATQNEQKWEYLDAETLWDIPKIKTAVKRNLGIKIVKHPDDVPMPDMTKLETAFQAYDPDDNKKDSDYDFKLRLNKPIYLARHNPHMLARAVMDAGRQVVLKHGRQPTTVLVDLPCTLFMLDNRHLPIIEDIARLMSFSPKVSALAEKVVKGIAKEEGVSAFNGVHLRMERDAIDWANILGGKEHYWDTYLEAMQKARFSQDTPLYVASGLLTGSKDINDPTKTAGDPESAAEMKKLVKDMVDHQLASKVVHKEMYLEEKELTDLSKEQSGLVDFLVLRKSQYMVGISVSTFSFYLQELRLLDGHAQEDTVMYEAYVIGTDQMFHTSAVVATETRDELSHLGLLQNTCRKRNGKPC